MSFTFRLYLPGGDELDDFKTAAPNWAPGDELITKEHRRFRVTAIIPADDLEPFGADYNGILEVEPDLGASRGVLSGCTNSRARPAQS